MDRTLHLCVIVLLLGRLGPRMVKGNPPCEYPKEIFGVQLESWNNIQNWNSFINNLTSPTNGKSYIQTLDLPRGQGFENIGRRMRTYFLAPETGAYWFYIACDDNCQLNLSTDEKLETVVTLVTVTRWTKYKQWRRSNSARASLSKGRSYLLEAILFQGPGDYHMTVRVDLPDGSTSEPISNKFLVKYAPVGSFGAAPVGDWGAWSRCSKTCGDGTQTRNRSCLNLPPVYPNPNTTDMEMRICYPITPCSLPHSIIQVNNISSTSLLVEWQDRWSQKLRQFQIIYNETTNEPSQNITVNASQQSVELHGLKFFTWYCVRVLVTRHGMQQMSPCVYARTEQDVPCSSPSGLEAGSHHSPFRITVSWKALSESCWRGIPRGYSIRLQVNETAHEINKARGQEFSVCSNSTKAVLQGLRTYTKYGLQVAAMTERGTGPYSEPVYVETCRCPGRIFVNWMHVPPLCVKRDGEGPTGLVPEVLRHMVLHGCGTCHVNKTTKIIYQDESTSLQNMISKANEGPQINLPITVRPRMPSAGEGWVLLPVVEVAGFAFLTRKPSTDAYARYLASSVMVRWPVFVMMLVMFITFGLAIWTVEKYKNTAHFPQRFTRGWREGVWCAFISMATLGYGDRYPKSVPGRLIGIVTVLVGVVMDALFIAVLTSSLTVFVFDLAANPDRGKKIGVITGSVEHRLGMRIIGSKGTFYDTRDELLQGLKSGELDGTLKDVFTVNSLIKDLNDSEFEVSKTVSKSFHYGIELTGEARHLLKDFQEYLRQKPFLAFLDSSPSETTPTVSDKEEAIEFFDPENSLYQQAVKITGLVLVVFATSGLLYHVQVWLKNRNGQSNESQLKPAVIKAEMRQLLEEFHIRMQRTYSALKIKHRRELLKLRHRRTISVLIGHIHRGKFTLEQQV